VRDAVARAVRGWWWMAAAAVVGLWAARPLERVLPPDLVLFARPGATYHLRAVPPARVVTLTGDVATLREVTEDGIDGSRRDAMVASGAVLEVAAGTAARVLYVLEDELHRPVIRVRVLEGPRAGQKGDVWRSALGRETPLRLGLLTPVTVAGAALAVAVAGLVRALAIVVTER